jgi:hypothetical protein
MTEHTPGPWQWCHPDTSVSILHCADDDPMTTGILIALGHEGCAERQGRNCAIRNGPSRDADLSLISAAPELLAALRRLLAKSTDMLEQDFVAQWREGNELAEEVAQAEAAIAKAEGRA